MSETSAALGDHKRVPVTSYHKQVAKAVVSTISFQRKYPVYASGSEERCQPMSEYQHEMKLNKDRSSLFAEPNGLLQVSGDAHDTELLNRISWQGSGTR